ncbi:MAG: hypothetical protein H0Z35_05320 [Thermoanaerobacteraceae bacterium]|nr:hypothetical protein [Thermoanaerobacteraceae bacterium]
MNKKVLLVAVILVVALGSWLLFGQAEDLPSLSEEEFPKELAGMSLIKLVTGEEAKRNISQLHGVEIEVDKGLIAMFGAENGSRHMVIWVTESSNKAEATKLLQIMDEKMPDSKAFSNYQVKLLNGHTYYYVSGIGLDNYYYQKGRRLYWVGIKDKDPEQTLLSIVDKI